MTTPDLPGLLSAQDLGRILSIKPNTLYVWARGGKIPHYRLGGLVRFQADEVKEWIRQHRAQTEVQP